MALAARGRFLAGDPDWDGWCEGGPCGGDPVSGGATVEADPRLAPPPGLRPRGFFSGSTHSSPREAHRWHGRCALHATLARRQFTQEMGHRVATLTPSVLVCRLMVRRHTRKRHRSGV